MSRSAFLFIAVVGAGFPFRSGDDAVDFSLCPKEGSRFKATKSLQATMDGKALMAGTEAHMRFSREYKEGFAQTFVAVKGNQVWVVEREYGEVVSKVKAETDVVGEPQHRDRTSPLSGMHLRGAWSEDGAFTLEVRKERSWSGADTGLKKRIDPEELRSVLLPLPRERKEVGEIWRMKVGRFLAAFGSGMEYGAELDGEVTLKLATITAVPSYGGLKCAVLEIGLKAACDEDKSRMTAKGKAYYSVRHRVIVGIEVRGWFSSSTEAMTLKGTMRLRGRVKVVARKASSEKAER